jgi:hypothetical protein
MVISGITNTILLLLFKKCLTSKFSLIKTIGIFLFIGVFGLMIFVILGVVAKTSSVQKVNDWAL